MGYGTVFEMVHESRTTISHIIQYASGVPWACRQDKIQQVASLLELRSGGWAYSDAEIHGLIEGRTANRCGGELSRWGAAPGKALSAPMSGQPSVAVISLVGVIQHRGDMLEMSGGTSLQRFNAALDEVAKDPDVKAVIIDIDSPGGEVSGVEESAARIATVAEGKQVIAVVNTTAASAAYWLASQASEIVIAPGGEVGSIGVWDLHIDRTSAFEKAGLGVSVVSAGEHKVERFPMGLSDEARAQMQREVSEVYARFVQAVSNGRKVTLALASGETFGAGRMVTDAVAVAVGMADRIGSLDRVLGELVASITVTPRSTRKSVAHAKVDMVERGIMVKEIEVK